MTGTLPGTHIAAIALVVAGSLALVPEPAGAQSVVRIAVGGLRNDAGLEPQDVEFLVAEVVTTLEQRCGDRCEPVRLAAPAPEICDGACQSAIAGEQGLPWLIEGSVRTFAGSYIVTLELRMTATADAISRVETEPLESAATLLAGTRAAIDELVTGSPLPTAAPAPSPAPSPAPAPAAAPPAPGPAPPAAQPPPPRQDPTAFPEPPRKPYHSFFEWRLAAHLLFWGGLALTAGSVIAGVAEGFEETTIVLTVAGANALVCGGIFGLIYQSKKKEYELALAPAVGPGFGGLGLTATF